MTASPDLLASAHWQCAAGVPGTDGPPQAGWVDAAVPGTVAGALLDSGDEVALVRDLDAQEWWYRCRVAPPAGPGRWRLELDGLATLAEVRVDDRVVLTSRDMFHRHEVAIDLDREPVTVLLRFRPLAEAPAPRRPRARWRTMRLADQRTRWLRTSLLGRTTSRPVLPAPVGPWRAVRLVEATGVRLERRLLQAEPLEGGRGRVRLVVDLVGGQDHAGSDVAVTVGDHRHRVRCLAHDDGARVEAEVEVPDVRLWWPHTHGAQPLYAVSVELGDGTRLPVGRVGFRTVEVDRSDGGFGFVVNGVPVFARGTSWTPPDPVRLNLSADRLRSNVELLRDGNHTMVRVPGTGVYEDERFLDLLDELGILLWQDCMLAYADLPDEADFLSLLETELRQQLTRLQGRPCLALVCGSADAEEQAQYFGTPFAASSTPATDVLAPDLVKQLLPGTAYLRSTPGGSDLPTSPSRGVTHYFGVPGYCRPLSDVRAAGVRFAAECLPVATPHDPLPDELVTGLNRGRGTDPDPRHAVHRDSVRTPWDMEDTRDHYVGELFGRTALQVRQQDPGRADTIFSATAVALYEHLLTEWRRPGSPCRGALTFYGHDLLLGPGVGLVDAADRPKPTWYAMRRLMAPLAVHVTDEGFDGLGVHLFNETAEEAGATLTTELYVDGLTLVESAAVPVVLAPRSEVTLDVSTAFEGFRDLSWAHRFGPPAADAVVVRLRDGQGRDLARAIHLPAGPARPVERDLGLTATLEESDLGPTVRVSTERFAQWVRFELDGWVAEDSWFHLAPGEERTIRIQPLPWASGSPSGEVRAFNAASGARIRSRS